MSGAKRKTPARKTTPKENAPNPGKPANRGNKAEVVEKLIDKVEEKLTGEGDVKATVGDYIRLVQLQKELEDETPTDIEVRWIDPQMEKEKSDAGT